MNALTPPQMRSEGFRRRWRELITTEQSPPDEELMLELRRRFKGEVEAFSAYLDRDLVSEWGYDRLG